MRVRRGTSEGIAGSRRIACVKHGGGFAVLGRWLSPAATEAKKTDPIDGMTTLNKPCIILLVIFPLPPGKRLQKTNWKDPPFYSWVDQLFL